VVLDEAHHAAATTYQAILDHVRPKVLLGLTATPERADGLDIRKDFGSDDPALAGRFTHELRLPDAIERRLLAPFHYFGVSDAEGVDFTNLSWRAGGYATSELDGVLGANDARARWVRDQFLELVAAPRGCGGSGSA
jgi:superfamily II DNA or RNA helicase